MLELANSVACTVVYYMHVSHRVMSLAVVYIAEVLQALWSRKMYVSMCCTTFWNRPTIFWLSLYRPYSRLFYLRLLTASMCLITEPFSWSLCKCLYMKTREIYDGCVVTAEWVRGLHGAHATGILLPPAPPLRQSREIFQRLTIGLLILDTLCYYVLSWMTRMYGNSTKLMQNWTEVPVNSTADASDAIYSYHISPAVSALMPPTEAVWYYGSQRPLHR